VKIVHFSALHLCPLSRFDTYAQFVTSFSRLYFVLLQGQASSMAVWFRYVYLYAYSSVQSVSLVVFHLQK